MHVDSHIHIHYSPCTAKEMSVSDALDKARRVGIEEVGLVVHLHPGTDISVFAEARKETDNAAKYFDGKVSLVAEVDLLDQQGHTSYREEVREFVDLVSLGVGHHQLSWVLADYSLEPKSFLIRETESVIEALSNIRPELVVHPLIYPQMAAIASQLAGTLYADLLPSGLVDEFTQCLLEHSVTFEFHCRDIFHSVERLGGERFIDSYMKLLEELRERSVSFSAGSDAHYLSQIGRSILAPDWAHRPLPRSREA